MKVKKCKWYNNAQAPVMFMIDDLANTWVDNNSNNELNLGEDWGYCCFQKNSMWDFLNTKLLNKYPYLKVTFFLVVGKRANIIETNKKIYSETIQENKNFREFLIEINKNPNIEIAYHGLTHGITGISRTDFVEEWQSFKKINEAIETINIGREIYFNVLGEYPVGGKYCGYKYNDFSDDSINATDFKWWCRHWDANLESGNYENYNYDLEMFNNVVDIPSTIDGSYYSLKNIKYLFSKKYLKSVINKFIHGKTVEQVILDRVNAQQIISIQEHTSPYRADKRIQYPNLIFDIENLHIIFNYLKRFDLWYATGTEIANYFLVYENCKIENSNDSSFKVECDSRFEGYELTLSISGNFSGNYISISYGDNKVKFEKIQNQFIGNIKVFDNMLYKINEV
ncbi:hypothetical protein [Candidatus Clostridium stratigraminis]|uniref:Polysaccharide deacetylase n=1 Tax=Candidatus Clostridium stratigraminis TaxID=3381661 RepID=A0ABW8T265_9CLOT